jgi:nucleoside-diphosphate-sugar epimerase
MIRKTIILTGASGNLGRNLRRELSESYWVIPVSLRGSNFMKDFQVVLESLKSQTNQTTLIHAAWPVRDIGYKGSEDNFKMLNVSKQIIEKFLSSIDGEVIGIGTVAEAGTTLEVYDSSPPNPNCLYSESKATLAEWISHLEISSKWLRVGYQFSKFDPSHKLIPTLLSARSPFLLHPNKKLDFIHVTDVARAIRKVLDLETPKTFLISTGRSISSYQIALALGKEFTRIESSMSEEQRTFPLVLQETGFVPSFIDEHKFYDALRSEVLL